MVWPWRHHARAHDPMEWELVLGRYERARWLRGWQQLFDTHQLVHNRRVIRRIVVSGEHDGAFAVVDVDSADGQHNGPGLYLEVASRRGIHAGDAARALTDRPAPHE